MSKGFNCARADQMSRRDGITYEEACRRMGRAGARRRQQLARQNSCVTVQPTSIPPKRRLWWQRED